MLTALCKLLHRTDKNHLPFSMIHLDVGLFRFGSHKILVLQETLQNQIDR